MAAVRLPRVESHRCADYRAGGVEQDGDAALVLPGPGRRRAAWTRACDRASQPRRAARAKNEPYAGREQLAAGLATCCGASSAWRWSTRRATPFPISRGWMPERSRRCGRSASTSCPRAISSSGSRRSGRAEALATHRAASERLYRIKDRAFDLIRSGSRDGRRLTSTTCSRRWWNGSERKGSSTDSARRRGAGERRAIRTISRPPPKHRAIGADEMVLLDLWGKLADPGAVFADITWVGFTGSAVPDRYARAFAAARDGRDAAVAARRGRGREGTRAARLRSGSCGAGRHRARRLRGAVHPPDRPQPRRQRCTATACTWTTTRPTTSAG